MGAEVSRGCAPPSGDRAPDQLAMHKRGGNSTLHDGRPCAAGVRAFADTPRPGNRLWRGLTVRAIIAVPRLLVPARRFGDHPSYSAAHFSPADIDKTRSDRRHAMDGTIGTCRSTIDGNQRRSCSTYQRVARFPCYATHNGKSAVKGKSEPRQRRGHGRADLILYDMFDYLLWRIATLIPVIAITALVVLV
jgi:hypothetical protein